jgi:hypothetical protein
VSASATFRIVDGVPCVAERPYQWAVSVHEGSGLASTDRFLLPFDNGWKLRAIMAWPDSEQAEIAIFHEPTGIWADFGSPVPEFLKVRAEHLEDWIALASRLPRHPTDSPRLRLPTP